MASPVIIAPPENLQLQSPLLRLPLEIKHAIYTLCFQASAPIDDALLGSERCEQRQNLDLGIAITQTCRRAYFEADRRPLFARNRFRFSTFDRLRLFLNSVDVFHRASLRDVEIDARKVHSDFPGVAREWLQFLASDDGSWGKVLESLRVDAPGLTCLRLNFEAWPVIPMFRAELWRVLMAMLTHAQGLERIVVIGASKGQGMIAFAPWSPVHFVGGGIVGDNHLAQSMWKGVRGGDDSKVLRWTRSNGSLSLEVVTTDYLTEHVDRKWNGPCAEPSCIGTWPQNGSCTWSTFCDANSFQPAKVFNPSASV